jgi:hypothetical protein
VLRDRLKWLVTSGAGLKALLAAGLAHALAAAAASGQPGEAAGGTTAGLMRAPVEELLSPFPTHVLVSVLLDGLTAGDQHCHGLLRFGVVSVDMLRICCGLQ